MAAGAGLLVLFLVLLLGVGASLALYALVRAEHDDRDVMDRADAERTARQDVPDRDRR